MRNRRTNEAATIDLTALIDVVFILIVFFLVTTTFKQKELAFTLDLPEAQEGKKNQQAQVLILEISEKGWALNGKIYPMKDLEERLKKEKKKTKPVQVRADQQIPYKKIGEALDLLQRHQFKRIMLVSDQK